MELLRSSLRIVGYHVASVKYQLKDKTPREDAFLDRLRMNGVTLPALNRHLDRTGFPESIGRFPELLSRHESLIDRINFSLMEFHRTLEYETLPLEEKRKAIFDYVSCELSEGLSLDPKVFDEYRLVSTHNSSS